MSEKAFRRELQKAQRGVVNVTLACRTFGVPPRVASDASKPRLLSWTRFAWWLRSVRSR